MEKSHLYWFYDQVFKRDQKPDSDRYSVLQMRVIAFDFFSRITVPEDAITYPEVYDISVDYVNMVNKFIENYNLDKLGTCYAKETHDEEKRLRTFKMNAFGVIVTCVFRCKDGRNWRVHDELTTTRGEDHDLDDLLWTEQAMDLKYTYQLMLAQYLSRDYEIREKMASVKRRCVDKNNE